MQRTVFNEDHDAFRKTIRDFIAKEVAPVHHEWEGEGHPPRDFYRRLGELGVLGIQVPEEFGGGGEKSFKFAAVSVRRRRPPESRSAAIPSTPT